MGGYLQITPALACWHWQPSFRIGGAIGAAYLPPVSDLADAMRGFTEECWSEKDQERINNMLHYWIRMLEAELKEKERTIIEIMTRLDVHDEKIAERMESPEYQSLLRKAFRDWAGTESEQKRIWIRNILSNAAASDVTSDDVIRLFIDWLRDYSELHFHVIGTIYNETEGISRGEIWDKIGKEQVQENSAEADLYRLLIHDLSVGRIIRQHRETTYDGRFVKKTPQRKGNSKTVGTQYYKSAFDYEERYELTGLGKQFVHYAMTDLPPKIEYAGEQ